MAAPRCRWMSLVALLCLCLSRIAIADPLQSSNEKTSLWELPIIGPTCDAFTPVCGEGGVNFESSCHAIAAGVRILETGVCREKVWQDATCDIKCFRADPVCGEDGITYWCGAAEAKCAGVEVASTGYCELMSGGAGEKGKRAAQSLFLVHLIWLALAGFLVISGLL